MATRGPVDFVALDHTGDLGVLVRAATAEELFERTAAAMFALLADPEMVREELEETFRVEAEDRETLLVAWLSELLYRHVVSRRLYRLFEVLDLGETMRRRAQPALSEAAALEAARRWMREGRTVHIARPPAGMDFNDVLLGRHAGAQVGGI